MTSMTLPVSLLPGTVRGANPLISTAASFVHHHIVADEPHACAALDLRYPSLSLAPFWGMRAGARALTAMYHYSKYDTLTHLLS